MRITIVEDNSKYVSALIEVLDGTYEVVVVSTNNPLETCVEQINATHPDVVLLDHDIRNDFTGLDIAKRLQGIRIIGISAGEQGYCSKHFALKYSLTLPTRNEVAVPTLFQLLTAQT